MPSIEIVCIDQQGTVDCTFLPFPVNFCSDLISNRTPSPLFQEDFDSLNGYIYHLLDGEGPTAYNLLKQDWYDTGGNSNGLDENVEFRDEFKIAVLSFLDILLRASKVGQVLFTSDYQFGPEKPLREGPMSVFEFTKLHDAGKIRMNASYTIQTS